MSTAEEPGFIVVRPNARRPYMACCSRLIDPRTGARGIAGHWWEDNVYYSHRWRTRRRAEEYATARVKGDWVVMTAEELNAGRPPRGRELIRD